ncbi:MULTISPECIES: helix-hairpin-helix domain-containing protein [Xanthomonas]|uniref:helix-hairpin-helix domain-containing protein n=1 Tax=Xanthomonas TaxID=338 RepID=UPI000A96590D|nr:MULTISPECIES: helix-hairpin-helix domain-containing protein [Xanthomonas]MEC5196346.1 hypothetical protein [Xanthomonas campestris]
MADYSLQLQADNLPIDTVEQLVVEGPWAATLQRMYTAENILLEGCRGAGKTMLMRTAAHRMKSQYLASGRSLGVHTTFKRYLATIPPSSGSDIESNSLDNFKAWINSRILNALKEVVVELKGLQFTESLGDLGLIDWAKVVGVLETTYRDPHSITSHLQAIGLKSHVIAGLRGYTYTLEILRSVRLALGAELLILFLDDAAHALDTRAQGAFFTCIKSLYDPGLAFKISVYPAVTRYGLDFSYGHDAVVVPLGDLPRPSNIQAFRDLLGRRAVAAEGNSRIFFEALLANNDWIGILFYCSNGNPRGLLKLVAQVQTQIGSRPISSMRFEDIRTAINTVTDRHLDNMVPGVIKDLDPRLLKVAELLLYELRSKISDNPGPYESGKPRGYLALTNSMQVPYLCQAGIRLLVAANVIVPEGPARLSKREGGTLYLLHPGFTFRDNVIAVYFPRRNPAPADWLVFFDGMASRVHAEVGRGAELWQAVSEEAMLEPSGECANGHPILDISRPCDVCGAGGQGRSPVAMLLNKSIELLDLSNAIKSRLIDAGFTTVRDLFEATHEQLDAVNYVGEARAAIIKSTVSAAVDEFVAG